MHDIFESYLTRLNAKRVELVTYKKNVYSLGLWDAWLTDNGLDAADVPHVMAQDYFVALCGRVAPSTARNHLTNLRSAYKYAIALEMCHRDPTVLVLLPKLPDREPITFTNRELRLILEGVCDEREDLAAHMLVYTGMRKQEISKLKWQSIDFDGNQIRVNGKQGKFRLVPIHPILREKLIESRRRHPEWVFVFQAQKGAVRPIGESWFYTMVVGMIDRVGIQRDDIQGKATHAFRRTVSSVLYEEGVRESYIESILGHSPQTVNARHYRRVLDKDLQDAIRQLYVSDPIQPQSRIRAAV